LSAGGERTLASGNQHLLTGAQPGQHLDGIRQCAAEPHPAQLGTRFVPHQHTGEIPLAPHG
jgi:hypothetical protein